MATAPLFSPLTGWDQPEKLRNWAGNVEYSTSNVFYPKSVPEVLQLIKKCSHLRTLGTRHCFNRIADSKFNLVSTRDLNQVVLLDEKNHTVTVEGGIKYGELCPWLDKKGFALANLASLPHISVAGSCATATHGSGMGNGNLPSAVRALELVTAGGDIVQLSKDKDGENFLGAVVGLGALGLVTKVTLAIEPAYQMRQNVYEKLPVAQLRENFEKIMSAAYSVSLFTDWASDEVNEVWIKSRVDGGIDFNKRPDIFGATSATRNMHPIAALSAENCTPQMGVPGPWYERLPHFKMGFTPSSGKELQAEYFVPRHNAVEAFMAVARLGKQISPHLLISEIRAIAKDQFWMSPCRNQDSVTIHFTWKPEWDAVSKLLPVIENELASFTVRPHWGKLFSIPPKILESRYEKLADFKKLVALYDPHGKFRNDFLDLNIYS